MTGASLRRFGMGRSNGVRLAAWAALADNRAFWLLSGWLACVFLLGGASRGDVASLPYLRPASVLVLTYALATLTAAQVRANRGLLIVASATVLLVLAQLVPLPPAIWYGLPGHAPFAEMDRLAGLEPVWRPLSLTPAATRNALWALMAPLGVIALAIQLDAGQLRALLPVVLVIGAVSAVLGLAQVLGPPDGGLYFYGITNNGSVVGLFANRNHQALFLAALLPMVLVWARLAGSRGPSRRLSDRGAGWLMVAAYIGFVLPLILVTGSRSGMVAALVALVLSPLLLVRRETGRGGARPGLGPAARLRLGALVAAGLAGLAALTIVLGRALAFDRLMATDPADELRLRIAPTLWAMIGEYWPWGTGFGAFEAVYRVHEPDSLLSAIYMNHAHNDWLELPLTGGLPALVLLGAGLASLLWRGGHRAFARAVPVAEAAMARLGLLVLALFALGSVSDYPLRVPSLACLAALAAVWAVAAPAADKAGGEHHG
ncbi:O-antigen ligase family protein [Novosphingobium album (ex Liu et al. 2023)]|uniref:O-antigen ligase family protein n=1 Tax=Novosphingobium album (ex Liu et al. 2023) TaxID=3031130 RepID=A0ABT5WSJ2_9SPHN|nr:O-antigen ligase family protein [Novosphingobium album (ex Liu et al. 2023)]MDE8653002.1 O-antigen ligase family protein [Novosphingobium album (ex Liu et al. 2023)]